MNEFRVDREGWDYVHFANTTAARLIAVLVEKGAGNSALHGAMTEFPGIIADAAEDLIGSVEYDANQYIEKLLESHAQDSGTGVVSRNGH